MIFATSDVLSSDVIKLAREKGITYKHLNNSKRNELAFMWNYTRREFEIVFKSGGVYRISTRFLGYKRVMINECGSVHTTVDPDKSRKKFYVEVDNESKLNLLLSKLIADGFALSPSVERINGDIDLTREIHRSSNRYIGINEVLANKENPLDDAEYVNEVNNDECNSVFDEYIPERVPVPKYSEVSSVRKYNRDTNVAHQALARANYKCEFDSNHTSFIRASRDETYMEPHHLVPLSQQPIFDYSLDVPANIVSLCSNCHNCIHYGKDSNKMIEILFEKKKEELAQAGIFVELEALIKMY